MMSQLKRLKMLRDASQSIERNLLANLLHTPPQNRISHSSNYQTDIQWQFTKRQKYRGVSNNFSMIKKNKGEHNSKNDSQIIQHIRNITKDLLVQSVEPTESPFLKTKQRENNKYYQSYKQQLTKTFQHHPARNQEDKSKGSLSRGKRLPIFQNFQDLWKSSKDSPLKSKTKITPIMDRINKNIYSRFKTESSNRQYLQGTALTANEKERVWQNFLSRQQKWSHQRKQDLVKGELRTKIITKNHHSKQSAPFGSVQRRLFYQTNEQKQMSKVQHTIERLKIQTENIAKQLKNQLNSSSKNNRQKDKATEARHGVSASSKQRQYPLRKTYA